MRGDIPDFTSSTELFTYIRHGVTRCTQQTPDEVFFWFLEPSRIPSENTLSGPFIKVSSPSYFDKYYFISWVKGRRQLICLLSHSRGRRSDNSPHWWYMWLLCWHSWSFAGFDCRQIKLRSHGLSFLLLFSPQTQNKIHPTTHVLFSGLFSEPFSSFIWAESRTILQAYNWAVDKRFWNTLSIARETK